MVPHKHYNFLIWCEGQYRGCDEEFLLVSEEWLNAEQIFNLHFTLLLNRLLQKIPVGLISVPIKNLQD